MKYLCIVFVCNKRYFDKFLFTCTALRTVGKYTGEICLVIGDDLVRDPLLDHELLKANAVIKHFPDLKFPDEFIKTQTSIDRPPHWNEKMFQYHKLYLFDTYFTQWKYIFYIDCGVHILSDIQPMLDEARENTLLAHSDAYPTYEWKLSCQFDTQNSVYKKLASTYTLQGDYFQTTIMLYDTSILEYNTFHDIYSLLMEYPISRTNDQGVLALYFTCLRPLFKQIPTRNANTCFYDYLRRNYTDTYIMLKMKW